MLASRPCFTKSDIFWGMSSECGGRDKPTRLTIILCYVELNYQKLIRSCSTPYEFLVPRSVNYSVLVTNKNMVHCSC